MATDDHPITALRKHVELEATGSTQFVEQLLTVAHKLPFVPSQLALPLEALKTFIDTDSNHRMHVMVETCADEILRLSEKVEKLSETVSASSSMNPEDARRQVELTVGLVFDAARKASVTRDEERVKRIGLILAHGLTSKSAKEADEIEDLMRIAMELSDSDVSYLAELVKMEGSIVRTAGRIERYQAHQTWDSSPFGSKRNPDVESAFSKLTSYGLVWRLPSPNNFNVMADLQNGYALLPKGLQFVDFIAGRSLR